MTDELTSVSECDCMCHRMPGVSHVAACCDGLPIDFWESEYEEPVEMSRQPSSKPRGRSTTYEEPDEWMSFIHSKRTGKPLRGPGSESMVD